ncbi:MAG: hypothetical protein QME06_07160 [Desulfobacterales bacterium]|nr:hypothetical protein [Desulfobacterales bacterium]
MTKKANLLFIVLLSVTISFIAFTYSFGDMKVFLKDGRIVNVPLNKNDILSISFEEEVIQSEGGINWNFESGNLVGWRSTGDVFNTQPTYGDNPTARHRGQPSHHEGEYWIGGYENRSTQFDPPGRVQGDGPQGTLTSEPFTITRPTISFLIGGGCDIGTERVELLIDGQVVLQATGKCTETMERLRWNVSQYIGRTAQIRVIDASGGGWGHINFDDLKLE